jgi:hypothetical protein
LKRKEKGWWVTVWAKGQKCITQKRTESANILASTFDNFVESVLGDAEKKLPVVDSEVADTWIS